MPSCNKSTMVILLLKFRGIFLIINMNIYNGDFDDLRFYYGIFHIFEITIDVYMMAFSAFVEKLGLNVGVLDL